MKKIRLKRKLVNNDYLDWVNEDSLRSSPQKIEYPRFDRQKISQVLKLSTARRIQSCFGNFVLISFSYLVFFKPNKSQI